MFTKILVAVNANSIDTVLASAIDTARKHDACILALHAVNPAPYLMSPIDYDFALMIEAMEAHGREIVARMAQVLDNHSGPAETRMITLPLSGLSVGGAIASVANTWEADLIILGERNASWLDWLSEDVALEMRRHANAPIQTVSSKVISTTTHRDVARWTQAPAADAR
ncbi:universal stress protein [Caballeronia sp. LjRoot29]|uniref:universal stress protein n=1 Tax=Caballeronia sp. LjRoot29 TaxID=3342315 RepID=UPI003ECC6450